MLIVGKVFEASSIPVIISRCYKDITNNNTRIYSAMIVVTFKET